MATKKAKAKTSASAPALSGTAVQITPLSPNSNCSASSAGDANNTTTVQFMSPQNGQPWWTGVVSNATKSVQLSADIGNAIVTFKKGLTITIVASGTGGAYTVFLSGNIVDNDTPFPFAGSIVYQSSGASSLGVKGKKG